LGIVFDIITVFQEKPVILLKNEIIFRMSEWELSVELLFAFLMTQSVPGVEPTLYVADILEEMAVDQLDHMEGIDHGDSVGKVFVCIVQIRTVHVTDEIPDPCTFPTGDLSKVGKGVFFSSADDQIHGFSGDEILQYQSVFASFGYVQVDFINTQDLRKLPSGHIDITGEGSDRMGIRNREPSGDLCCTCGMIPESLDDQKI